MRTTRTIATVPATHRFSDRNRSIGDYSRSRGPARHALLLLGFGVICLGGCAGTQTYEKAPGLMYQQVAAGAPAEFHSILEAASVAQRGPIRLTQDASVPADFQLELDFRIRDEGLNNPDVTSMVMSFYFLNAYPTSCGHYQFTLEADLFDANGQRLGTWYLIEDDTAFTWFFSGKDCKSPSEDTVRKIGSDLLTELYAQIAREGALMASRLDAGEYRPLVYVRARNAAELVERVTKTDAPFGNFTFTSPDSGAAHWSLNIGFEFINPQTDYTTPLKHPFSALTAGMISNCASNRIELDASVTDGAGKVVQNYHYTKYKQPSNFKDCGPTNDDTDPDIIAKMLKQLYKDIGRDNLF